MAIIILLPSAASEPVQQQRRVGRFPKAIVSLHRKRLDKQLAAYYAAQKSQEVQSAASFVETARYVLSRAQQELALAHQRDEARKL